MSLVVKVNRRDFLRVVPAAGAGLVLGFRLGKDTAWADAAARAQAGGATAATAAAGTAGAATPTFAPNAYLQVAPDGVVTVWVTKSEMGQGVRTSLPMILAEEIGADLATIRIEQAWFDPRFGDQDTGGSASVRTTYAPLRKAGATARAMLLQAAAKQLGVNVSGLVSERGQVIQVATGRRLPFAALVADAAALPVPADPPLKDPDKFTIVGRTALRTDSPMKVDGSAGYGIDVKVRGMLYASVSRCAVFGGKMVSFDDAKAKAVPGVRGVVPISRGVAVLADSTWAAFQGRKALKVTWDEGDAVNESTAALRERAEAMSLKPGKPVRHDGDADAMLAGAAKLVEATYEAPFQAHAPMEPVNVTAHLEKERCTVWAPTQTPGWAADELKKLTGLPAEAIRINITLLGGGFGRRISPDFILDAVEISKAIGQPVKMTWSRDEDLQHDVYRPYSHHRLAVRLGDDGLPAAWRHRLVTTSIADSMQPGSANLEGDEIACAADLPYAVPNIQVEYHHAPTPVPRGWWRSVDAGFNAFVVESFLDECAAAAGQDPLHYRQALLRAPRRIPYPGADFVCDTTRLKNVLQIAAEKAGWGTPLPKGQGRGLALSFSYQTYYAQVAEVEVASGKLRVRRLVSAIDCGRVINPGIVAAQIEGGAVFGLTASIKSGIVIERGRVTQTNFDNYEMLRIDEMPHVEGHIVPSREAPTGVGEPVVTCVAPATFNAVFAATGRRIRRLPLATSDLSA
jgi:isoquinoline 1-oxidoreductase beta subunit